MIGVFDSGVGGLSILREIRRILPNENLLFYSDNAFCPYGIKPVETIVQRTFTISDYLISRGADAIVVACNTASIAALDKLRQRYQVPIVGIEPAVKPATSATKNGHIGVLATSVALAGERFASLVQRYASDVQVFTQPAPGLVELVEAGKVAGPEAEGLLHCYLDPLLDKGVDTIVLGCTHYPFLKETIERLVGPDILIIDTGEPVARQTARILEQHELMEKITDGGKVEFLTSGLVENVEPVVRLLWGDPAVEVSNVKL